MTGSGPSLLVMINGNVAEWQATVESPTDVPRLPLPYAMGAACLRAGFRLNAVDTHRTSRDQVPAAEGPFDAVYAGDELMTAVGASDLALLWGTEAVRAVIGQMRLPSPRRRVIMFSYSWSESHGAPAKRRVQARITRIAARFARAVVLMTREQVDAGRRDLPSAVAVVHLAVGIDTAFYAHAAGISDVDEAIRERVARFIERPFAIMPGDELRLNDHALEVVERTSLNLLRISQYGHKSDTERFKAEIVRRKLQNRILVLERIPYRTVRFLFQSASVYAGLVDATWQPAGWTVLCESLASGLPVVVYDGLAARELATQGVDPTLVSVVPMNDTKTFARALDEMSTPDAPRRARARTFAQQQLDLQVTGARFAADLRAAVAS